MDGTHSPQSSWAGLADAEPVTDLPEPKEQKADTKPDGALICEACGEVIVREPGARGRKPKYHPECKPQGATAAVRTKRVGGAQAEADEVVTLVRGGLTKFAILLAAVDKYDAFVVMVNTKPFCEQLRGTLIRYPAIRKQMLDVKGSGSLIGLVITGLMVAGPILAHHGLLPFKTLAPILVNAPKSMYAIQQQLKNGEENLIKVMQEQMAAKNGSSQRAGANVE